MGKRSENIPTLPGSLSRSRSAARKYEYPASPNRLTGREIVSLPTTPAGNRLWLALAGRSAESAALLCHFLGAAFRLLFGCSGGYNSLIH
jgi:hypothetical protein